VPKQPANYYDPLTDECPSTTIEEEIIQGVFTRVTLENSIQHFPDKEYWEEVYELTLNACPPHESVRGAHNKVAKEFIDYFLSLGLKEGEVASRKVQFGFAAKFSSWLARPENLRRKIEVDVERAQDIQRSATYRVQTSALSKKGQEERQKAKKEIYKDPVNNDFANKVVVDDEGNYQSANYTRREITEKVLKTTMTGKKQPKGSKPKTGGRVTWPAYIERNKPKPGRLMPVQAERNAPPTPWKESRTLEAKSKQEPLVDALSAEEPKPDPGSTGDRQRNAKGTRRKRR
jgi:hypothetical protein